MTPRPLALSDAERLAWLRLSRSENVGPVTFLQLLNHFGSAEEALRALPELAHRGGQRRSLGVYPRAKAERELEACAAIGARLVALGTAGHADGLDRLDAKRFDDGLHDVTSGVT